MADATTADPTNAVEVAALLTEAAEAGTAVEAMRIGRVLHHRRRAICGAASAAVGVCGQ